VSRVTADNPSVAAIVLLIHHNWWRSYSRTVLCFEARFLVRHLFRLAPALSFRFSPADGSGPFL